MPDFNYSIFVTNHDQNRVMSLSNGDVDKAKNRCLSFIDHARYAVHLLQRRDRHDRGKPGEDIRPPMQWSGDEYAGFSITQPWRDSNMTTRNFMSENKPLTRFPAQPLPNGHPVPQRTPGITGRKRRAGPKPAIPLCSPYLLRESGTERILLVVNLGKNPIADYQFDSSAASLSANGNIPPTLFGGSIATPLKTLSGYKPCPELPPYQMLMLEVSGN